MTEEQRTEILKLHSLGLSPTEIKRMVHLSWDTVKRTIDPEYQMRRRSWYRNKVGVYVHPASRYRPIEAEVLRLQRLIPADTRSITGRICGDPLPGRSALDQRRSV